MDREKPQYALRSAHTESQGFSLPIAVLAGFLLLLGSLALASRSGWGLFGSAFQNKNWAARSAAETGMNVIVNELNRPQNRWLSVLRAGDPDPKLWTSNSGSPQRQNPCITTQSPPPAIQSPDYTRLDSTGAINTTYSKWYIQENGDITASPGNANISFRLVDIERQAFATNNQPNLSVWRDRAEGGVGSVTIQVEGQSYQNGKVISSVVLERTYELTPKCCGSSFGGKHGNIDYSVQNGGSLAGTTVCIPEKQVGLGLLAGAAGTNTGSITVRGSATSVTSSTGTPVNPIYCIATSTAGCAISTTGSSIGVSVIDIDLPKAYEFCNPPGGAQIYGGTTCASGPPPAGSFTNNSTNYSTSIPTVDGCLPSSAGAFKKGYPCGSGPSNYDKIVYDFSSTTLPPFCAISRSNDEVHCNVEGGLTPDITARSLKEINFLTGTASGSRKVRLYFPGDICARTGSRTNCEEFDRRSAGNLDISNCSSIDPSNGNCTASSNITDLSLFGSNTTFSPQPQSITMGGTQSSQSLFVYFPTATVNLRGTSSFSGVLWTNDLGSTGTPTWTIPRTGITEVLQLVGLTNLNTGQIDPLLFDFVLRGTDKQRWLGG